MATIITIISSRLLSYNPKLQTADLDGSPEKIKSTLVLASWHQRDPLKLLRVKFMHVFTKIIPLRLIFGIFLAKISLIIRYSTKITSKIKLIDRISSYFTRNLNCIGLGSISCVKVVSKFLLNLKGIYSQL